MNLDLINNFLGEVKENKFVQNFINELSNYLERNSEENPIVEEILSKNKVTTANANSIRFKEKDVILKYAEKIENAEPIYFVKDSKKKYFLNNKVQYNNDVYAVLKVRSGKIEEIEIDKKDMPKNIGVNDVFRMENGQYVYDEISTKKLQEEIRDMAKEIIDKQNVKLDRHRKEDHLYMVTEELGNNRFLLDLTGTPKVEFEEVDIPKDLLSRATEGIVLKYTNGNYEYYSDDGYERIASEN